MPRVQGQCCFTFTEIVLTIRDREPRNSTSTFTQILSSEILTTFFKCCFTSRETVRIIRDGEPRTATSTFTQLLRSEILTIFFKCCFTSTETVWTRDGHLDGHLGLHTAPGPLSLYPTVHMKLDSTQEQSTPLSVVR